MIPLRIFVHPEQFGLLPLLKSVFPDLRADVRSDGLLSYFVWVDRSVAGTMQVGFLRIHKFHFLDLEKENEYCITEFFRGVRINGVAVREVCFPGIIMAEHFAALLHFEDGYTLQIDFPLHWLPLGGVR